MATAPGKRDPNAEPGKPPGRPQAPRPPGAAVVGLPGTRPARGPAAAEGVLVLGREIEVKGEIRSCRVLVVEGRLEADVEVGSLELARSGYFDGRAEVETAGHCRHDRG